MCHGLQLQVYKGQLPERLRDLMSHGLLITLNADDPAYFGGYECAQYAWMMEHAGLSAEGVRQCACNGFTAAFMPEERKQEYIRRVNDAFKLACEQGLVHEPS